MIHGHHISQNTKRSRRHHSTMNNFQWQSLVTTIIYINDRLFDCYYLPVPHFWNGLGYERIFVNLFSKKFCGGGSLIMVSVRNSNLMLRYGNRIFKLNLNKIPVNNWKRKPSIAGCFEKNTILQKEI